MKISELLDVAAIAPALTGTGKEAILREMVATLRCARPELPADQVLAVLLEREELGSTGIGEGVAIPHGKLRELDQLVIAFGRHPAGVDFDSMDGRPTHLFFMLLAPETEVSAHLKALARISKLLKKPEMRERLLAASNAAALYEIIAHEEETL